jgi:hypothetical protein
MSALNKFVPDGGIELESGEKIEIPKLTWKREIKIYKSLSQLIEAVPELKEVNFEQIETKHFVSILPKVLNEAPDAITTIVATLLGKEPSWVLDNMCTNDMFKVLTPFFRSLAETVAGMFQAEPAEKKAKKQ